MSKLYEAVKPIGRFVPGDFVAGLSDSEILEHLSALLCRGEHGEW
ncbi:hypothetical protein [Acinetobacter beijerinckii]